MKCEEYQELFTRMINNELSPLEKEKLDQHLAGCGDCVAELQEIQTMWSLMAKLPAPEPSSNMRVKFDAMLNTYKKQSAEKQNAWSRFIELLQTLWRSQPQWPFAYNIALILVFLGFGYLFLSNKNDKQDQKLQQLASQVHELKQTMMIALLENPSASERIRAVSYTPDVKHLDKEVIDALLATLNNDPNVNVRLATLDALTRLAAHPEVRQGLIASITTQDSPLMESAIADVMLKLQDKRSVNPLKKLLKERNLDHGVRAKISETINSLI